MKKAVVARNHCLFLLRRSRVILLNVPSIGGEQRKIQATDFEALFGQGERLDIMADGLEVCG